LESGKSLTRAQRVFQEQTRRINEYYEKFRLFHFSLHHALNGLGGDIPADKLARLLKNVDPSGRGYRVDATCEAALQSLEILTERYQFPISDQETADSATDAERRQRDKPPRKPRGPTTDVENHQRVAEIVRQILGPVDRLGASGQHQTALEQIATTLDESEIRFPKTWRRKQRLRSWQEAVESNPRLATKAIDYRLKAHAKSSRKL
jgi:hypothetical protein